MKEKMRRKETVKMPLLRAVAVHRITDRKFNDVVRGEPDKRYKRNKKTEMARTFG
jgi:hypothetical protein